MREVVVIKCGGTSVEQLDESFFLQLNNLIKSGVHPVIVHGGGGEIKQLLNDLQLPSEFVDGLRKTCAETMDVVEMVLGSKVNKAIVRRLNRANIDAIGLTGSDGQLLMAEAKDFEKYGFVGDVSNVRTEILEALFSHAIVPVIAPIAIDHEGNRLNINADSAAAAVAIALHAKRLLFVTDVPGIMHEEQVLKTATEKDVTHLIDCGVIHGGMLPKVEAALNSIRAGVDEVVIVDGNQSKNKDTLGFVGTTLVQ